MDEIQGFLFYETWCPKLGLRGEERFSGVFQAQIWNANSYDQDLNSDCQVLFPQIVFVKPNWLTLNWTLSSTWFGVSHVVEDRSNIYIYIYIYIYK